MNGILLAAILFAMGAIVLSRLSKHTRRKAGIPRRARVLYSDTSWKRLPAPLISRRHSLVGKPDYVLARTRNGHVRGGEPGKQYIPMELKPTKVARTLYKGDKMQLAAYMLLVAEKMGPVTEGIVKYKHKEFVVDFDENLVSEFKQILGDMRRGLFLTEIARNHRSQGRCRACAYRSTCREAL